MTGATREGPGAGSAPARRARAAFVRHQDSYSAAVGIMALGLVVFAVVLVTVRPGHHPPRLQPMAGQGPNNAAAGSSGPPGMPVALH
ncbi:MAG: hypothetical protein LC792_10110 [Actinobacteria bacterium]|nr:hypothetical protein [Actinomycetota bacterium]